MTAVVTAPTSRRVTGLVKSTPGRLSLIALLLVAVTVVVGALTAWSVQTRSAALEELANRSEPLSFAAQEVYRSMADADATAASAFLSGGVESPALRSRYEADIAKAAAALSTATGETSRSPEVGTALSTLAGQLPVYTGLVETARTHNRQGNPVGAAYLREASSLMRAQLLPAAQGLYRAETANVVRDQDSAGGGPWSELLLGLVALASLGFAQWYVTRRSNRVFNVGLVVATGLVLVSLLWVSIASAVVATTVSDSRENGSAQVDVLARARIATLTARGDETLTLVARGSGAAYEKRYGEVSGELGELLARGRSLATAPAVRDAVTSAEKNFQAWQEAHRRIREADDSGDYTTALGAAIGPDQGGAAVAFDNLDRDLVTAITQARTAFTGSVATARGALTGTVAVVALLALGAAAASVMGVWQRLKEYR
ncbi:hypothetical protein [Umezawaea sp.]|uniref:hypothetical protein n=1 Tax=Umezawaea sp. TaxID=1955258 RepID=UPI002ED1C25E